MPDSLLDRERWNLLWQSMGVTAPSASFELLACLYAEPHRRYHGATHIIACLQAFEEMKALASDPKAVELAIWLHDAVYDPLRHDNEARSADLAEEMLTQAGLSERTPRARELILATRHDTAVSQDDAGLLVDIDLSVLALPISQYQSYVRAVRKEYAAIEESDFIAGRIRVLQHFLQQPTIYAHSASQSRWEQCARNNLNAELRDLMAADR